MATRQTISLCVAFLLSISISGQVNNIIFIGGNGNGSTIACFQSFSNNAIYAGGYYNGFTSTCQIKVHQNLIFSGGFYDGNSAVCFISPLNNLVFAGGDADGSAELCFQLNANSPIFSGGYHDGNAIACYLIPSSNAIFAGNTGDGYDAMNHLLTTNNFIFAGNSGDGYDSRTYGVQVPTLVWHGQYNSNWHYRFNWDQNRIPTIEDHVIIKTEKYDPNLVKGKIGIGIQDPAFQELGRNLSILSGSKIYLDKTSIIKIRKQMDVYGSFISYNQSILPVIEVLPGGRVTIFHNGIVQLLEP